jgi:allophanate hydrolase subunit 1
MLAVHVRARYHHHMQLVPAGDNAILVELGEVSGEELHAANAAAREVAGVLRSTPGHSSLYVIFDRRPDADALTRALSQSVHRPAPPVHRHQIGVAFDGADLGEFLALTRQTREEFAARVEGLNLVARYIGFRGGFAYLDGWPGEWAMPRRVTSRPVAAGSFAIAGSVAAFYPIDSPGGWNLLGRTDEDLEDAIEPGDVLVIRCRADLSARLPRPAVKPALHSAHDISAPLATWTDRPFDDVAAALANRAVGNPDGAPLLECPLVGPRVRLASDAAIAWCTPDLRIETSRVRAGEERSWGRIDGGLRAYLAIGDREERVEQPSRDERLLIRAARGPHDIGIESVECEVTPQLDRVGIRLRPLEPLEAAVPSDMRSIGMQVGTVQLHPNGDLVAMGPDHPVTGGYLQPLTVLRAERWKLAQLVPGERVTFVA